MVNIARFQRAAMYDIARLPMNFNIFMAHVEHEYHADCATRKFPALQRPPQPLDEQVIIGRALCNFFLFTHKLGNLTREPLYRLPDNILGTMTSIQDSYVINRHRGTPALQRVMDSRPINHLNRGVDHLIPFWSIINQYCPEPTARNLQVMIFDARYIDDQYVRHSWLSPAPILNCVDQLIHNSQIYEPIRAHLRALRNVPGFDHEPGPFADDPPALDNATFARLLGASLGQGVDRDDEFLHLPAPTTPTQPLFPIAENIRIVTKRSCHREEEDSN